MNDLKIGSIILTPQCRDAIHMAVAPVVAAQKLSPGDHVGLDESGLAVTRNNPIGIVDPFLTGRVQLGETFWLFLYPNTVTSLRHEWEHPAFAPNDPAAQSKQAPFLGSHAGPAAKESRLWLKAFAESAEIGLSYDELMEAAVNYLDNGDYMQEGGRWHHPEFPVKTFWDHFEAVTGRTVKVDYRDSFFSCSC